MSKSYYEILEVNPDATEEEIRQAYRKLAKKYHPDRNGHPDARTKFIEVSKAGRVLLDQKKRQEYDSQQKTHHTSSGRKTQQGRNQQEAWKGWEDIFQEAKDSYREAKQESKQQESWEGWEDLFEDVKESYRQGKGEAMEDDLSFEWGENIRQGIERMSKYLGKSYFWVKTRCKNSYVWTQNIISELEDEPYASDLSRLLLYPRRSRNGYRTVVIGSALTLLSILIVPAILVQGYLVRLLRSAAIHEERPPVFDNWCELLQDGIKLSVVNIFYVGISDLLLSSLTKALFDLINFSPIVRTVISLNTFSIWLFVLYLLPAAQMSFAINKSLRASFDFSNILDSAFTVQYFLTVVIISFLIVVFGIVTTILSPIVVGLLVPFYAMIIIYYVFSRRCSSQFRTYKFGS